MEWDVLIRDGDIKFHKGYTTVTLCYEVMRSMYMVCRGLA
jgi:hypothetical protein